MGEKEKEREMEAALLDFGSEVAPESRRSVRCGMEECSKLDSGSSGYFNLP